MTTGMSSTFPPCLFCADLYPFSLRPVPLQTFKRRLIGRRATELIQWVQKKTAHFSLYDPEQARLVLLSYTA